MSDGSGGILGSANTLRDFFESLSAPARELLIFAVFFAFGLLVVPPLIWVVGTSILGPYENGDIFALMGDVFAGLAKGSPSMWIVALGPYALVMIARLFYRLLFGTGFERASRPAAASAAPSRNSRSRYDVKSTRQAANRPPAKKIPTIGDL